MGDILPPPSTAVPAVQDRQAPSQTMDFTPVWRKWFIDLARIINRSGGLDGSAPASRKIETLAPLSGGGDLTEDRNITFAGQAANRVLASPSMVGGAPSFRPLVAEDMPGETVIIVTAKLTPLGNEGQMTFVNGVLMSNIQAT